MGQLRNGDDGRVDVAFVQADRTAKIPRRRLNPAKVRRLRDTDAGVNLAPSRRRCHRLEPLTGAILDASFGFARAGAPAATVFADFGRTNVKQAPAPSELSAQIRPRCPSMISLQIARPRPVPL